MSAMRLTLCLCLCAPSAACTASSSSGETTNSVDITTCVVKSDTDDISDFNSLRRKIEKGFNQTSPHLCTELIYFDGVYGVALKSPLRIDNLDDGDCDDDSLSVCNDGIALDVPGPLILDATFLPEQHCAITINANNIRLRDITILSTIGEGVLCNTGTNNDLQVTLKAKS